MTKIRLQPVFTAAPSSTAEIDLCIEVRRRVRVRIPGEEETFTALSRNGIDFHADWSPPLREAPCGKS